MTARSRAMIEENRQTDEFNIAKPVYSSN